MKKRYYKTIVWAISMSWSSISLGAWTPLPESEQNYPHSKMYINMDSLKRYPQYPGVVFFDTLSNSLSNNDGFKSQVFRTAFNCQTGVVTQLDATMYSGSMATGKRYDPMKTNISLTDFMQQTWIKICMNNQKVVYNLHHGVNRQNDAIRRQIERDMQTDDIVQQLQMQQQLDRMMR